MIPTVLILVLFESVFMPVLQEFSRFATEYNVHNTNQRRVAERVVSMIKGCPKRIVDIGCGTGAVYGAVDWDVDAFMALDFSEAMLAEHPDDEVVFKQQYDFNQSEVFDEIQSFEPDAIVSASALQWSVDIEQTFRNIAGLGRPTAIALFTANTFRTLHECAGTQSPIHDRRTILEAAQCFEQGRIEFAQYRLPFDSTVAMLRYIKRSGVSGGDVKLSVSQVRRLIDEYPLDYLEFEVVYIQQG